jgi:hypothetical protein
MPPALPFARIATAVDYSILWSMLVQPTLPSPLLGLNFVWS